MNRCAEYCLLVLVIALLATTASVLLPVDRTALRDGPVRTIRFTDRHGLLLREVAPDGRSRPVNLDEVDPVVVTSLLATEDAYFYEHHGIHYRSLMRALWTNVRAGRIISGGSTITMQVARALRASPTRSLWTKLAEMHLAVRLEVYLTKDEILQIWLNRVPFGNQVFGIETASRFYFGKGAADLTPSEATFLVGLPQSPSRYNPMRHFDRAVERQQRVLDASHAAGVISDTQLAELASRPPTLFSSHPPFAAPHVVDRIRQERDLDGVAEIRTTIELGFQRTVAGLARSHLDRLHGHNASNAAAIVIDNASGDVLAYLGSADYWDDRAAGQNDGVRMLRQPGSALKPFAYAAAIAQGVFTQASILPDIPTQFVEAGGAFSPSNYDKKYHGPVSVRQALANSYNVPAAYLARTIGPGTVLRSLRESGFRSLDKPASHYGVGLVLGNGEVTLEELARAYSGLARHGNLPELNTVVWMRDGERDTLYETASPIPPAATQPFLSEAVTSVITDILTDPEAREPAFGRGGPLELPFPCAVKTGTSKDYRDNWAVGYTPRYTVAVWVGNFDGAPMRRVSGVSGAGPLLKSIFLELGPGGAFDRAAGLVDARVCIHSGLTPNGHCPTTALRAFLPNTQPDKTCDIHRLVEIDRRTGGAVTPSTPAADRIQKLVTVYPALFQDWLLQERAADPQGRFVDHLASTRPAGTARVSPRLVVRYPESGTVFQVDPILRPHFQRVRLRGSVDEGLASERWIVDDVVLGSASGPMLWRLSPGQHRILLEAIDEAGEVVRSAPADITVSANF